MFDIENERDQLDEEYRRKVKEGECDEFETVIVLKGRSAYECYCCGEEDLKYLIDEGRFVARAKDIKSIRFYNKTEEKERNALTVPKKIVEKGAFDDMK